MEQDRSYVIGTHDAEIERLGVQHRVWRAGVLDFWRLGGLTEGMTVIDAGAGPGHATLDLAEIVGPTGRVIALERSRRFLDTLEARARQRGITNIQTIEIDLADFDWSSVRADILWCRWVLAFVADPSGIVRGMAKALEPGGEALIHEYYDYGAWHMAPPSALFDDYIAARWPMGFAREYLPTLAANGAISATEAETLSAVLSEYEANPRAFVITPGVLQIAARKP